MMSRANYLGWIEFMVESLKSPLKIKDEVACFFEDLYRVRNLLDPCLTVFLSFDFVNMQSWLKRKFEEEEVWMNVVETLLQVQMVSTSLSLKLDENF